MTKKSYNKFVATAATATLVASAIAPVAASADSKQFTDVNERYAPAVDYVVSKGVQGKTSTQFGVQDSIKRVDAAVFIANALDLNKPGSPDAGFSDVPARAKDAVNALKEKGIINGKTDTRYGANDVLTRGEVALILASAYNLKGDADSLKFTDVNKNRYGSAVAGLVDAGVTDGISATKFGTENPVKRGDLAVFLYKLSGETPEVPSTDGITSVKAINDTRYEVTFNKAFDKDVAREIEKEPSRIIAFDGAQNANSSDVIKAETVTFNSDNKVATVTFNKTPKTDINYTVALMDNKENAAATVVAKSSPQVLVKGAETPSVDVNADQDKIVIDFKQKMDKEALNIGNYTLYDDKGNKLGALSAYAKDSFDTGNTDNNKTNNWVDATSKKAVEFELLPKGKLEAGKTYKIAVNKKVKTDDGYELTENKRTVDFKTPSISEARPEVKFATIKGNEIIVHFDKDLDKGANLTKLVKVKTATGNELDVKKITVDGKKAKIEFGSKVELDKDSSYTVELPENVVANAYFYNALNKSGSVKAKAVEDKAVTSMKAAFEKDSKSTRKANLVLSFDREVTEELKNLEIRVDGKTYTLDSGAKVEYGKTHSELKVKNVEKSFKNDGEGLQLEDGKTYEIVAKAEAVKTDSTNEPTNKEELKATVTSSISVAAPRVKRMELVSADEIVVEFDQSIDGKIDASDVKVRNYYILDRDGSTSLEIDGISDENYVKVSVSGKKVTIKTAANDVKFGTGGSQEVTFDVNAFKGSNGVENVKFTVGKDKKEETTTDYAFVDNAAPEIVGAQVSNKNAVVITYSEYVNEKENIDGKNFASQFTFEGLENRNYGSTTATVNNNEVTIEFDNSVENAKDAFKVDKNYPNAKIKYEPKTGHVVKDNSSNKAKAQTWTGIAKAKN